VDSPRRFRADHDKKRSSLTVKFSHDEVRDFLAGAGGGAASKEKDTDSAPRSERGDRGFSPRENGLSPPQLADQWSRGRKSTLTAPNLEEGRRGRSRLIRPLTPLQDGVYPPPGQRQGASQLSARELNIGGRALLQGARLATRQAAMAVLPRVRVHSLGQLGWSSAKRPTGRYRSAQGCSRPTAAY
jgi:hypothetical protein